MNINEINVKITYNYLIKLNTFKLKHTALEVVSTLTKGSANEFTVSYSK